MFFVSILIYTVKTVKQKITPQYHQVSLYFGSSPEPDWGGLVEQLDRSLCPLSHLHLSPLLWSHWVGAVGHWGLHLAALKCVICGAGTALVAAVPSQPLAGTWWVPWTFHLLGEARGVREVEGTSNQEGAELNRAVV